MKRFLLLPLMLLTLAFQAQAQKEAAPQSVEGPQMTFEALEIDYGTIEKGADPYRVFAFTNTGNEPLLISNARGSCGCTVPTWPKQAIPPGATGEIKVRYDTNRVGPFQKRVTLTTNAGDQPVVLTIKGKVENKPAAPDGLPTNNGGSVLNGGGR